MRQMVDGMALRAYKLGLGLLILMMHIAVKVVLTYGIH